MKKQFRDENTDMLMKAVMSADNLEECYEFFADLCTENEIKLMSQRFQVARMLRDKRMYSDIVKETEAGTLTINKVKDTLSNGTGAYVRAIERAENDTVGGELL